MTLTKKCWLILNQFIKVVMENPIQVRNAERQLPVMRKIKYSI